MTKRGLTLIEILIATVVLVLGVLGLAAMLPVLSATGARVETRLANDGDARSIAAALRLAAREHSHVRWAAAARGAPQVASVFLLLPHAAAHSGPQPDPTAASVFGARHCLLLPFGSDKVFVYPRAGEAAQIQAANGNGIVANATENLPTDAEAPPEALYRLYPGGGTEHARSAFALRVQRASEPDGRKLDGLYLVTILLYRGSGEALGNYTLTEHFPLELAVGPTDQDVLAPGTGLHPHDWVLAADAAEAAATPRANR